MNWRGNSRSLPRESEAHDLQGETEGAGLVYPGEEEAKGQSSSSLHLPRGELQWSQTHLGSLRHKQEVTIPSCRLGNSGQTLEKNVWFFQ